MSVSDGLNPGSFSQAEATTKTRNIIIGMAYIPESHRVVASNIERNRENDENDSRNSRMVMGVTALEEEMQADEGPDLLAVRLVDLRP